MMKGAYIYFRRHLFLNNNANQILNYFIRVVPIGNVLNIEHTQTPPHPHIIFGSNLPAVPIVTDPHMCITRLSDFNICVKFYRECFMRM
uniref:Uncharacterized protein n=1 Tax=Pararge aegeria TaxID=116150 RepID=S4PHW0_9NEOP